MKSKAKKIWLVILLVMTVLMISIGGITRMTRSGLSIVEWKPISGFIPPTNDQEWSQQFEIYKQSPEFQQVNQKFEIEDYKKIYFWEYLHRLWGRLIFFVAFFAGIILALRKKVEYKIVFISSILIGLQGIIGWLMVKSGLNKEPLVSPYMLALHFISANVVFIYIYSELKKMQEKIYIKSFSGVGQRAFRALGVTLFLQVIYGGLVSGFRAGYSFNTWPLMGGEIYPPGGFRLQPIWMNLFENPSMIQWVHRWLAFLILAQVIILGRVLKADKKQVRGLLMHLHATIGIQLVLGIFNLLYAVPIVLAVFHQFVAVSIIMGYANFYFKVRTAKQA